MNDDRLTSMGISNAARKFLDATKALRAKHTPIFTPAYFTICQSIELSLKAFLRGSGFSDKQLRKLGHDLIKALNESQKFSLDNYFKLSTEDAQILDKINQYYYSKDLQYITSGYKSFPHIDALIDFGDRLWHSTRDFCEKTRNIHDGMVTAVK